MHLRIDSEVYADGTKGFFNNLRMADQHRAFHDTSYLQPLQQCTEVMQKDA
jgi:hypothetical protein